MQGIAIFDGRWAGVSVATNLVIANAWHGIARYGVKHAFVANNTVIPARPDKCQTWIVVTRCRVNPYFFDTFVDFDLRSGKFDLGPAANSPALRAGADDQAPPFDIEGRRRISPADIGAYAL